MDNKKVSGTVNWERLKNEQLLYLSICPKRDREVLTYKRDMSKYDFKRIMYFLTSFGFDEFAFYLEEEYSDAITEFYKREAVPISDYDVNADILETRKWSQAFYDELPTKTLKTYIGELLCIYK